MKKLLFIVVFVSIVFVSLLNSLQMLTQNWSKPLGYPFYELVEKKEVTNYPQKRDNMGAYFSTKQDNYITTTEIRRSPQNGRNESFVTLKDASGKALWSIKELNESNWQREFFTSSKGVTFIRSYNDSKSIAWVDTHGEVINRMEFDNNLTSNPILIGKEDNWIIQREPGRYDDSPDSNVNSSLIFCDSNGNVLNEVVMKYPMLYNDFAVSENDNYIIFSCTTFDNSNIGSKFRSYLLNFDGTIIKEYEGKVLSYLGDFSENEDVYVSTGRRYYVVDIETTEIITSFKAHSRAAIANKETGIIAVLDYDNLRIVNYETKRLLFHETFDVYPVPSYVEISGDAKEVIVITKSHQYTFRMKE
ncbi:MAG: hypothetical protein HOG24_07335 [Candidatus Cloacimonetes bacterium]|nr:hypothetical protein [Candidatus Cloacimonadota bacterium]